MFHQYYPEEEIVVGVLGINLRISGTVIAWHKIVRKLSRSIALLVDSCRLQQFHEAIKSMLFSEFDFELPDDLIAQHPTKPRERSRLMVVNRRDGRWEHRTFAELPELLAPHDVLARNNTRVIPARLVGRRVLTGGRWEGLFLRERPGGDWQMLATTRGQPMPGESETRRLQRPRWKGGDGRLNRPAHRLDGAADRMQSPPPSLAIPLQWVAAGPERLE